jgi:hypothetical protein
MEEAEMRASTRRFFVAVCGLLAIAALGGSLSAQSEYRGRMFVVGGPNRPSAVNVKVVLDAVTTLEEVTRYQTLLGAGDIEGFYAAFREHKKGSLQFTGGLGLRIDFYAASELKTETGTKLVLAGESRNLDSGVGKRMHGAYLFLVVELNLDKNGSGDGRLYEDGRISFTATATLALDSYVTTPKEIVSVRKTK